MIKISVHNNLRSLHIENVGTFVSPTSIKTAKFVRWLQLHIVWSRVDSTKVQPVFDHAPSIFVLWRKKQESDEYGNLAKICTPTTAKRIRQLPLQNDVDDWGYMNKILQVIQYRCMFTSTINLAKAKRNVDRFYLYSWSQLFKFNHNTFFPVHLCSPNDRCILLRSKIHCNLWPLEEQCLT